MARHAREERGEQELGAFTAPAVPAGIGLTAKGEIAMTIACRCGCGREVLYYLDRDGSEKLAHHAPRLWAEAQAKRN